MQPTPSAGNAYTHGAQLGPIPIRARTETPYVEPHQWQQPETQTAFARQTTSYEEARHSQSPQQPGDHAYIQPDKIILFQKAWSKENNYTGRPYDILADKAKVFRELCYRLGIPQDQYANIFPGILSDRASTYYLHNIGPGLPWDELYDRLNRHFNTSVNHNQYWTDWTTLTFERYKRDNPAATSHEALEAMIDKLTLAQRALGQGFSGELQLHTTIVRACRGHPDLEQAMFNPKNTVEGLLSDLRASLQVAEDRKKSQFLQDSEEVYYTDRRYNNPNRTRGSGPSRGRSTFRPKGRGNFRSSSSRTKQKCFVCHKEGCWSTNHPPRDTQRARRQYMSSYADFYEHEPSAIDVQAYILDFEGEPEEEDHRTKEEEDEQDQWSDEEEAQKATSYLTSTAYLHRTTGSDPSIPACRDPAPSIALLNTPPSVCAQDTCLERALSRDATLLPCEGVG
ncbi:hypothetical protein PMIN01_12114 [Paraphaeosphaeria minitans]|uniref:CCHC-type domain-containing protein n=1 Tax=Paraphaeosphaeria minitans TaxID=565426 RepID=A0A9P6KL15_9PLEO|nr:hypothetical protein PMIN01_12114 [Paraphaeosphaeria minitans]